MTKSGPENSRIQSEGGAVKILLRVGKFFKVILSENELMIIINSTITLQASSDISYFICKSYYLISNSKAQTSSQYKNNCASKVLIKK